MRVRISRGAEALRLELAYEGGRLQSTLSDAPGSTVARGDSPFDFEPGSDHAEAGTALGRLLLPGEVADALRKRLDRTPVRLLLAPTDGCPNLPWEFARVDAIVDRPLVLHPRLTIVREGGYGQPSEPYHGIGSVLIALANPGSDRYPSLAFAEAELESILRAFEAPECRHWRVEVMRYATADGVRRAIRARPPTVLHFIGHGDRRSTGSVIAFEGGHAGVDEVVYVDELGGELRSARTQLVVLSACDSAGHPHSYGAELAAAGIPAVVGMQRKIDDDACQLFARALYGALGEGAPIEDAVRQARLAISGTRLDWGAPVLILNSKLLRAASDEPEEEDELTARPISSRLPSPLTSFVGRVGEMAEVAARLGEYRLVSLVGPGGIGKTRLAIETARRVADHYPDGVWFVGLQDVVEPGTVASSFGQVFGSREKAGESLVETLANQLSGRHLLIVVDNCEHVQAETARVIRLILEASPDVRVLATTRSTLGVKGERIIRVPALAFPSGGGEPSLQSRDAIRLFADRAALVSPTFRVNDATFFLVSRLAQRLDGMPLALELAAARMGVMSLDRLVSRLDAGLSDLKLLDRGDRPRHQTLTATMDWSYELLNRKEQALFARLAVFAGSWTAEAAEEVAGFAPLKPAEVFDLLVGLVDKSLVAPEEARGEMRYRFLQTVRAYARTKLDQRRDHGAVRERFFATMRTLAKRIHEGVAGADLLRWRRRFDWEIDNYRSAIDWGLRQSGRAEDVATILLDLHTAWIMRSGLSDALGFYEQTDALLDDHSIGLRAVVRSTIGKTRMRAGDASGLETMREAARMAQSAELPYRLRALELLGWILMEEGEAVESERMFREDAELRGGEYVLSTGYFPLALGSIAAIQGKYGEAETHFRTGLANASSSLSERNRGVLLCYLAQARLQQSADDAGDYFREGIGCLARVSCYFSLANHLAAASWLCLPSNPVAAAQVQGFADHMRGALNRRLGKQMIGLVESLRSDTRDALSDEYARWHAAGRELGLPSVLLLLGINGGAGSPTTPGAS